MSTITIEGTVKIEGNIVGGELPGPGPNPNPQPPGELTVPPLAAEKGFKKLIFQDEFDGPLDIGFGGREKPGDPVGHKKWSAGLFWYNSHPPEHFKVENSILTLTGNDDKAGGLPDHVDLATQWQDHQGGTQFLGGYFEARIWSTNWSAFWLFCWNRPKVWGDLVKPNNPLTWTNEIDILECDPAKIHSAFQTLHANTSGDGGVADQQNWPIETKTDHKVIEGWNTYGMLWTKDDLTWVINGVPCRTMKPYQSTWQPVQLILSAAPNGIEGTPSKTKPSITRVDYVRVWA